MTDKLIDFALYTAYFLLIISVILGIVMPLITAIGDIKSLLKGLVGIVLVAVVFGIAFTFASGQVTPDLAKIGYGSTESRLIGAGLISLYILLAVSFIGIFVSEIINLFK